MPEYKVIQIAIDQVKTGMTVLYPTPDGKDTPFRVLASKSIYNEQGPAVTLTEDSGTPRTITDKPGSILWRVNTEMTTEADPGARTSCEFCALYEAGDTARAQNLESVRSHRLLLAMLRGAPEATGLIAAELHGCQDCTGRLAAMYLGGYANALAQMAGGELAAATVVERIIDDLRREQG